jgi:beta-glucosidase
MTGVVPEGWVEVIPGTFARASFEGDPTVLLQAFFSGAPRTPLIAELASQLELEKLPTDPAGLETANLAWDWYVVESTAVAFGGQETTVDLALAETDAGIYLVVLGARPDEYDLLHEAVFLPAVQAFAPPVPLPPVEAGAAYLNPDLPVKARVDDLLARMTLVEKIGQMTLVEKNSINRAHITDLHIGALLSGGGGYPEANTPQGWAEMVDGFQEDALDTRLRIPLLYGVDAVHGHNNVKGAVIFPHNIGLGAANSPELMEQIGRVTAIETAATGIYWNYAPCVAVPQDIRWGRTYEGYSENTDLVATLATAYLRGLQGDDLADRTTVLATPKHYLGDGATAFGTSTQEIIKPYLLDQGDAQIDEATLRAVHLPPYKAAIDAGAKSIMPSFSSWSGIKVHGQPYLLTGVLRDELGFQGVLVSDWGAIDQISDDYYEAVVTAINAGVDMNMVPYDYIRFMQILVRAVDDGDVPLERVDDAVRRILSVKFELGLFEHPYSDASQLELVGSEQHRALAREAVAQSLVLLKNEGGVLPIANDTPVIFVGGHAANDIGIQSGGWTIEWQGKEGNITPGTTILDAIEASASQDTSVYFNRFGRVDRVTTPDGSPIEPDVCIAIVGERPYAEGVGDSADLALPDLDLPVLENMSGSCDRLAVILLSGRPVIITDQIANWDALVAAWLPGTEGQGVADALFGVVPFTGKMPYTWPRTVAQLPFDFDSLPAQGCDAPLFPFGYGLDAEDTGPLDLAECADEEADAAAGGPEPLPLVDDFEDGGLPRGTDGYASIGYFTWSDGSAVSIQTLQVDEGDDLALPEQVGTNTILQLNTDIKSGGWAGFTHALANETLDTWTPQDWSTYEGLAMWVFGNGTGGTLFVDIQDNRNPDSTVDDAERWSYDIPDDFEGWQYIEMPFEKFRRKDIGNGAPNDGFTLTEVHGYAVGAYGSVVMDQQTNYLDQVTLYGQAPERAVEVSFAKTQYSVKEGGRTTLRLKLSKAADEPVTVEYFTVEGDATLDRDYALAGEPVVFEPGTTNQSFTISATDDAIAEGKEQTVVVLADPIGAVLGIQARAILSVRDNESLDPSLISGFDEHPPFLATEGVTLSTVEVAADTQLALPDQVETENVLEVTYETVGAPAGFTRSFAEGEDWSNYAGLSFWFHGSDGGDTITVEILDNQTTTTADVASEDWVLVWSDEFDDPVGTPPDPSVWKSEVGDGLLNGIPGWGNGELEYYTASPENAATDGEGNLVITARRPDPETSNLRCWYGPCEYTSARLITWGRTEFEFGRVEARLKLPYGQGMWPAFWMLGTDLAEVGWPQSGEVDIVENVGREPATAHGTIHGPGYSGGEGIGAGYDLPEGTVSDDFHVYAIEWTPDQIRWFVDDVNHFTVTAEDIPGGTEWVYDHPFFLILNLAVGGNWPGLPDETTTFPQTMHVDYVRVYGAASTAERFEYTFANDFAGWKQIVIPFDEFKRSASQPDGAPDDGMGLTEVWGYGLRLAAGSSGTFYLDRFRFE